MLHSTHAESMLQAHCVCRDNVFSAAFSDTKVNYGYVLFQTHSNLRCMHQLQPWCCFIQLMLAVFQAMRMHRKSLNTSVVSPTKLNGQTHRCNCATTELYYGAQAPVPQLGGAPQQTNSQHK